LKTIGGDFDLEMLGPEEDYTERRPGKRKPTRQLKRKKSWTF